MSVQAAENIKAVPLPSIWRRNVLSLDVPRLAVFALAYFIAYGYGTLLFSQTASAPLWFPDSVLLCALLLVPRERWWLYFLVAIPIRFIPTPHPSVPHWFIAANTANDLAKAMLAAYLLRRLTNKSLHLETLHQFAIYLLVSVWFVPMASAAAGATTRYVFGYGFWAAFYQWFLGDSLANLVLTPALLYWCWQRFRGLRPQVAEVVLGIIAFVLSLLLALKLVRSSYSPIALCVPFPFLIWAATRLGPIGASTALSGVALLGTAEIAGGTPFLVNPQHKGVLFLQLLLFMISVPLLFLSILIEERSAAEKNLRESAEKLKQNSKEVRHLAGKLISAQDEERRKIALELHDDIGQRLALLATQLQSLDQNLPEALTTARDILQQSRHETERIASLLRELSHQLHSSALQYLGLPAALKGLCRTLTQQHNILVEVQADQVHGSSPDLDLCLFRIAQEALTNAIRHGHAQEITVRLTRDTNQLALDITDNGLGFNPSDESSGLGLIGMRERVSLVNGTIEIDSKPMGGTAIHVRVPLESQAPLKTA